MESDTIISSNDDGNKPEPISTCDVIKLPPELEFICLDHLRKCPPTLRKVLIEGMARVGSKILIAGPSKSGKTFLLVELAIALATGGTFFGRKCRKVRVLYIDLELTGESYKSRVLDISSALGIKELDENLVYWPMRGANKSLDEIKPDIIDAVNALQIEAVIIDPIYKLQIGNENDNAEAALFMNSLDEIAETTGAAVFFVHHFAKGNAGAKNTIDRASGAGVFARDPDTIIMMTPLKDDDLDDDLGVPHRIEYTLRDFPALPPTNLFFRHPLHVVDENGILDDTEYQGVGAPKGEKNSKVIEKCNDFLKAFVTCEHNGKASIFKMSECNITSPTIKKYATTYFKDLFELQGNFIVKK